MLSLTKTLLRSPPTLPVFVGHSIYMSLCYRGITDIMRYIFVSYIIRYYGTIDDSSGEPIHNRSSTSYLPSFSASVGRGGGIPVHRLLVRSGYGCAVLPSQPSGACMLIKKDGAFDVHAPLLITLIPALQWQN